MADRIIGHRAGEIASRLAKDVLSRMYSDDQGGAAGDGEMYRMTEDHSGVKKVFRNGLITPEAAREHPDRSVLPEPTTFHTAVTYEPEEACARLIELTQREGAPDNVTVGIVRVLVEIDRVEVPPPTGELELMHHGNCVDDLVS